LTGRHRIGKLALMRRSSRVLIAGLLLLVLGMGNWLMGVDKTDQYGDRMRLAVETGGAAARIPFTGTTSILVEYTAARELYADSKTKYEYYRVVRNGGVLLIVLGAALIVGALIRRWIVPDSPRLVTGPARSA
jgi:hypothetical protein